MPQLLAASTTFRIDSAHPDFVDATFEFAAEDNVRCKIARLLGPGESKAATLDHRS